MRLWGTPLRNENRKYLIQDVTGTLSDCELELDDYDADNDDNDSDNDENDDGAVWINLTEHMSI